MFAQAEDGMNNVKTMVLMAGLMGLFLLAGQLLGGSQGLVLALVIGSAFNFIMYFFSDRMVLRMYGARVVTEAEAPELYRMVDRLRQRAGLPMPTVAVAPHEQPNAFATGRNPEHAVVAVTTGILKYVPQEELEGVLAHELAHVKNRDMLITTIAAGMAGAISNLPYLIMFGGGRGDDDGHPFAQLALLLLAPIGAMLIQFAVSRQREFEADRVGAQILGRPMPLANALRRLDALAHQIPMEIAPAAAPLAQVNPLAAHGSGVMKLFSTHPPTEERVARLEAMVPGR
jgi:heat shock protein HtpX